MVDLSHIDFEAIVDQVDKLHEAEYFLKQARRQTERDEFRWNVSAFFNAAYSYFDSAAMHACHKTTGPNGESIADDSELQVLRQYIKVDPSPTKKNSYFVKTEAVHTLVKALYDHRKDNTHYFPMSIMIDGPLPEGFQLGSERGKGIPVIQLCTDIMNLIVQVQGELDSAWNM